jgi:hypothetical protein
MSLLQSITKAYKTAVQREWNTIYVLVDVHDTIADSNYTSDVVKFFPHAIDALKKLSKLPEVYLVLWTSCYEQDYSKYLDKLKELGVEFKAVNKTPIQNTKTGCFDLKPYFSILIDDKAGFDPNDWYMVPRFFEMGREKSNFKVT